MCLVFGIGVTRHGFHKIFISDKLYLHQVIASRYWLRHKYGRWNGANPYTIRNTQYYVYGVSNHQHLDCLLSRFSGAHQRKYWSSASLAFVRGIHRWPEDSPPKGPVTRKMFPFYDIIIRVTDYDYFGIHSSIVRYFSMPLNICPKDFTEFFPKDRINNIPALAWSAPSHYLTQL